MHLANSLGSLATIVSILSKLLNVLISLLIAFFMRIYYLTLFKDVVWILHRRFHRWSKPKLPIVPNLVQQPRLCGRTQGNMLSDSWQKMGWAVFGKEELKAPKDALHTKLSSISVLLATAQL